MPEHSEVTLNQERYLLHHELVQLRSGVPRAFNAAMAFRLRQDVDDGSLQEAFDHLIGRHSSLRSSFRPTAMATGGRRLIQIRRLWRTGSFAPGSYVCDICDHASAPVRPFALHGDAAVSRLFVSEVATPFDHQRAPLIRAALMRRNGELPILLVVVHHLVSDWLSLNVIRNDLEVLYASACGRQVGESQAPGQYSRFASWQRTAVAGGRLSDSFDFWSQRWYELKDRQLALSDIGDTNAGAVSKVPSTLVEVIDVPSSIVEEIKSLARQSGVTVYVVLLAATALVLHACTRREHVSLWSNFANRPQPWTRNAVGWFANSHLLGFTIRSGSPGLSVIQHVAGVLIEALAHQQLPLAAFWAQRGGSLERPGGRILFDLHVTSGRRQEGDLIVEELPIFRTPLPVALDFRWHMTAESLRLHTVYAADRLSRVCVRSVLQRICWCLRELTGNPERPIFADCVRYRAESC